MNYGVDFYRPSNDVIILFNWYLGCVRFFNFYWIDLLSLIFIVSIWIYCSLLLVRALRCWIGLFGITLMCWGCCGGKMTYSLYFMLFILQLCCYWYGPLMVAVSYALLAIIMDLSALLYEILLSWPFWKLLEVIWIIA